ncbi:6735_t:CDS:2 [Dentiscutata erythropus]|uniref:6735_t:CDS:1 n=1 Tax=Dentiscutata erythropus TaxID=1348616 RepID=A0A9N9EKH8_9GLOM|nr:6735_t:CDS:2 [Dentiscutata erythropus]
MAEEEKVSCSQNAYTMALPIASMFLLMSSSRTSSKDKLKSREEFDNQLDSIEEKYTTLFSQSPQKKPKLASYQLFGKKASNEKPTSVNFIDAISQILGNEHHLEPTNVDPNSKNTENMIIPSNPDIQYTSLSNIEKDTDIIPIDNIESITTTYGNPSASQCKGTKQSRKRSKSTKK